MAGIVRGRWSASFGVIARFIPISGGLFWLSLAYGQTYLTPNDVVLPTETASQETLQQSGNRSSLRFAGLDLFPHAAITGMYDDNLLISHDNPLSDFEWTFSPGLTVAAGDVSTYLPGSITLGQVRDLFDYSLVDDSAKPQRFIGIDYTPSINVFTENNVYNNVDQRAGLTAGYAFSRLAIGLDQDYSRVAEKDNEVGNRITQVLYETKLRTRYEITDRSSVEVNGRYSLLEYDPPTYEGFQEFRNDNWFNRQIGAKANAGLGLVLGFVFPDVAADQTYQQLLLRGVYRLTGKMDIRVTAGAEFRQYESGRADTLDPVVSVTAIYQASEHTTFTLDVHRLDSPSPLGDYNYITLGFYAGVQQVLFGRWSVGVAGGYDSIDYLPLQAGVNNNRSDGYFSLQASLDYEMNRHLKGRLFYIRRQNDSTIETFSYANNMAGIQVTWRF